MESSRRPFGRSLSKEPGLKRPRLVEEPATSDRFSNGRTGFVQRPTISNSGGGVSRQQKDRDSESSDSVRAPYQHQPGFQELVAQYKTALAELTFNSKPIITNLTIIAGENLHAAKAIAATVCANILEVPSDQKLPSLYLLDSIVKNIGRYYIKYFASKLPEVFCKAYRHVDPSVHPGMRHLFGTWKGVFPPHTLQMIDNELGFTNTSNGSPSGITSRPESQAQRPTHGIHVNPKYLEARQRLQSTGVRAAGSDTSGGPVNSLEDVESLGRTSVQRHPGDHVNDLIRDRSSSAAYADTEYGSSDMSRMSHKKNGFGMKHGFERFAAHESPNLDSGLSLKQNIPSRNSNWKNSEEEEYMWDEMNSISTVHSAADPSVKDHWAADNDYRLDFDSHLRKPQNVNDIGLRDYDETPVDSMSMDLRHVDSGTRGPWSDKLHPPGRMLLDTGKNISGYPEAYPSGLTSSQSTIGRAPRSPMGASHIGAAGFKSSIRAIPAPKVSRTELRQAPGAALSSIQARMHQRPPSPSLSSQSLSRARASSLVERNQTSIVPKDPRKAPGHKDTGYIDQFSESSLPSASQDTIHASKQKLKPQVQRSSPAPVSRIHAPSGQPKNLKVSEFESSDQPQKLSASQVSGSESRSSIGNSSSDQSNPHTVDSPGQSFTSSSLDAALKSGSSLTSKLAKPSFPEVIPESTSVHSESNPVSSLISSLVAKGLISASKSDSHMSVSEIPNRPLIRDSEIATTSSASGSPVPVPVTNKSSSYKPAVKDSDSLLHSTANTEPRIGFEFKPSIIRQFHPDVIVDLLSDLPHQCSICGLGLKLQDSLVRHMKWHALQVPEKNPSRKWYVDSVDWVTGTDHSRFGDCSSDMLGSSSETLESAEPMVPADETQFACVLCGDLFEDFYCRERNEWMFKGAVHLTVPSPDFDDGNGTTGPIVHANCISESSLHSMGIVCDVKLLAEFDSSIDLAPICGRKMYNVRFSG